MCVHVVHVCVCVCGVCMCVYSIYCMCVPQVRGAIESLLKSGVDVKMITGDSQETGEAISEKLGLWTKGSISLSGEQLEILTDHQLTDSINQCSLFYRVTPKHKVIIVKVRSITETVYILLATMEWYIVEPL